MKNKILSLGAAALLLASCSSDDSGSSIDQSLLLKKWYQVSYTVNGQTYPYEDHEECGKDYIEFKTGNIFRSVDVFECEENVDGQGTYSVSGNQITLHNGSQNNTATVLELTAQTFKVQIIYDYDENGTDDTVIETYSNQ